ncbi:hypothetical protein PVL29_009261 [Vitis rotundifolia]|uniref:TF-B3 domain-containing protein n=1 Tax=Vitis rotundifolia TaxID=103349 RepID=A0AA38ZXY2_VITRO|nr:hypothetical protein PVL29_009261 [Vitis rotundifolia]
MSEKRDSASFPNEEAKKKIKLDISSSSGSDSNVKQGDGSEEGAVDSSASAIVENKPRNQDDMDFSSRTVPASIHDQDSQTKKTGSSSASCSSKDQPSIKMNKRTLLYKKSLTHDDVTKFKIMIPLESGRQFIPEPEKVDGKYKSKIMLLMDHDQQIWPMDASFDDMSNSYMLCLNWDKYFKRYELEAEDVIFLYFDPAIPSFGHFLIEYEKKGRDSNPKETD